MKNIIFLSGLPRSGSTVLTSLLNQHSDLYATTTSPVTDLINNTLELWPVISQAYLESHSQQFSNLINGIFEGAYKHVDKNIIIDKNRMWPRLAPSLFQITGIKPKIICTVRNIPDIMASYILLIQKNNHQITFVDKDLMENNLPINNKNRCKILLEKYINHPYQSLQIGFNSNCADMIFFDYHNIVENSQNTMNEICNFLNIDSFTVDTNNLQQMKENDTYHGGINGLHDIRSKLEKTSPNPENVIGKELTEYYHNMKLNFWEKEKRYINIVNKSESKKLVNNEVKNSRYLEGDSLDYDLLYRAAETAINIDGLYCEIGVRRGGSLKYIIDSIDKYNVFKNIIAIDPYGNIDYSATENFRGKLDYTNDMKNESIQNIYNYVINKNINLVFFNLEDTEFFDKFGDGVPVYVNEKNIINKYSFVFFDGPHDVKSIENELDFFLQRVTIGSVFVFDDIQSYPHNIIHERLLKFGFETLEIGKQQRKISYQLIKLNITENR